MTTETHIHGEWPSPIGSADVARMRVGLSFPVITGAHVWWQETRPAEGGRVAVVRQGPDGVRRDLLPVPWNARTRVHEYGGRSYLPLPDGFLFANFADQRLYRCWPGPGGSGGPRGFGGEDFPPRSGGFPRGVRGDGSPRDKAVAPPGLTQPLTAAPDEEAADRFADFVLSPGGDEVWCVRERHAGRRITRAIVAVPLDGSAAGDAGAVRVLVSGSDFYAFPAPSPDGSTLAWVCWDHPRMPWDGTELRVAAVGEWRHWVIMGGDRESVLAPVWRDGRSLYVISDRSGWWNLYLADLAEPGGAPRPLCPREEEFAAPLWQLGTYPFAVLDDGRLAVSHGTGPSRLGILDPETGQLTDLDLPYQAFSPWLSAAGQSVAATAGGPAVPLSVVRVDIPVADDQTAGAQATVTELRREAEALPDAAYLPVPRAERLAGPSGSVVHALVYTPANPAVTAPDGELPPYIVWVHGGPTSHVVPRLDLEKAFFTSRGIGIIDVNYSGSSGYGRAYRERLRGQWGVVDVADVMAAALALAEAGEADGKRLGVRGGSAGGWTALAAVTSGIEAANRGTERGAVFAAAVSYSGVSNLRGFAAQTHDFESRYLDGLIGPLPESGALYAERAPVGHVNGLTCPILLLQGLDDPVVPPAQSESIATELAARGIPYALMTFAGESHGFRKAESIVASLEAELSFYGQIMGFTPPGVPPVPLTGG
jgi:dipeptidyl aminopeptidase/acylaminoacyl peptidase